MVESERTKHTCLRLELFGTDPIFVKGTWYHSRFDISVTDGSSSWVCNATEEDVAERAAQWDQPVSEYLQLAEQYLGFQQPNSVYSLSNALEGCKRLSWTFEKEGTKLECRWKCKPSHDSKKITVGILDFLMEANVRLSEEVVNKTRSFEKMKSEAEKCLTQGEKLCNEKMEFEEATYAKFLSVLNAKKAKLRALRDKEDSGREEVEEEESTDKGESFESGRSDNEQSEVEASKKATTSRKTRGRKRAARMIDSLGRSGNTKESLRLFDEMKQREIRPSVYVYRALIDCLKKSGDFQRALQLSDELKNTSSLDMAGPQDLKRHLRPHRR